MWEIDEGELVRFRCHVGHAYTAETMNLAVDESLRRALSSAQRAFDERIALLEKMRERSIREGHLDLAKTWARQVSEYRAQSEIITDAACKLDKIAAEARDGSSDEGA